jgi:NADPH-dependent 2,4-dienoyl-CoA reductase/sulfur reductase-like enzyme
VTVELQDEYDVAIVGAGPAGLAAASLCARSGLSTVIFDEQPSAGGQIYRAILASPLPDRAILGADYWAGEGIARELSASGAHYVPGAKVWSIAPGLEIGVSFGGGSRLLSAQRVIIATGALERPFPIPGWTLPGVMTAGAAQALLKSSAMVPSGRTVIAGSGPLLWLLASQLLNAGAAIECILDTTPRENRAGALKHLGGFLVSPYLAKGLKLLAAVRRRVRVVSGVTQLAAEGEAKLASVTYRTSGAARTLPVDTLLLHQGVVPNVNLAMAAGVDHRWDDRQLCWLPKLEVNGVAGDGIYVAGDGAGIGGGQAAAWRGVLAASDVIHGVRADVARPSHRFARTALARFARGRRFLDALYRPAEAMRIPEGDTIVCRCEEVTAAQVIDTVKLGCPGPNQMKSFLRCGMGPCQGRLCGLTVTELIAKTRGVSPQEVGYYRIRPPVKPITVDELASLPKTEAAVKAVVRS